MNGILYREQKILLKTTMPYDFYIGVIFHGFDYLKKFQNLQ